MDFMLKFFGIGITLAFFVAVAILIDAWVIMIAWGMLGNNFHFFTISFSQAFIVAIALLIVQLPAAIINVFTRK